LARIYAGAVKFRWPEPFLVMLRGHMDARSLDKPLPTICAGGTHIGLAQPFILTPSTGPAPRSTDAPLPTITTGGARNADPGCARPAVVEGFILNRHGENGSVRAHTLDDPIPTADCRGAGYLVEPFIANMAHSGADESRCRSLQEPLQTLHAGGGSHGVVEPFILSQASGGAPRGVREPVPTIPAGGAHALIAPYYGSGSGESCTSPEQPLPTVTTKARFGLVVPVTNSTGGPRARSLEEPLPTMTTAKGGEFGLVMPVTHADGGNRCRSVDEPLPTVTGAHRGELAFIAAAFGERAGQAPRVHDLSEPTPTICAQGRIQLVEPVSDGRTYDIRFRMLEPHELARAMGFSDAETEYEFVGNKTEVTRMIGNAVAVHTATALVYALMS
jgi:DNA (cytosine-5)-methyltransferase 1